MALVLLKLQLDSHWCQKPSRDSCLFFYFFVHYCFDDNYGRFGANTIPEPALIDIFGHLGAARGAIVNKQLGLYTALTTELDGDVMCGHGHMKYWLTSEDASEMCSSSWVFSAFNVLKSWAVDLFYKNCVFYFERHLLWCLLCRSYHYKSEFPTV